MAYYVAALPIIYYGTSYTANQLLNATKEYFCDKIKNWWTILGLNQ